MRNGNKNIYEDDELQELRTYKDFLQVRQEGRRREMAQLESDFDKMVKGLPKK